MKAKKGPKGKYHKWLTNMGLTTLKAWARDGLTDEQIASNMGISPSTLYNWKSKYSEISESLKEGKELVDIAVENALYKRAVGYEYDEVTREPREGELVITKIIKKQVVPDTTAQIFWLKNRKPREWRDKQELQHSGEINNPLGNFSDDELRALVNASLQQ